MVCKLLRPLRPWQVLPLGAVGFTHPLCSEHPSVLSSAALLPLCPLCPHLTSSATSDYLTAPRALSLVFHSYSCFFCKSLWGKTYWLLLFLLTVAPLRWPVSSTFPNPSVTWTVSTPSPDSFLQDCVSVHLPCPCPLLTIPTPSGIPGAAPERGLRKWDFASQMLPEMPDFSSTICFSQSEKCRTQENPCALSVSVKDCVLYFWHTLLKHSLLSIVQLSPTVRV